MTLRGGIVLLGWLVLSAGAQAETPALPKPTPGDFVIRDFHFESGEVLPELKIHYRTFGTPQRDSSGVVRNAVLILHGTSGSGESLLTPNFAGVLFGPGQVLDASRYYLILPDGIGHGGSTKPSNGLHMKFPHYTYNDMVDVQHRLLTEKLGVNHLRLVMGTSMGGMQSWMWAERYPDFMDAAMPLASLPVPIAGRNRMMRRMIVESIKNDPEWKEGEYEREPRGLTSGIYVFIIMSSSPLQMQKEAPTRDAADKLLERLVERLRGRLDANDLIYQLDASRNYDPSPELAKIRVPLLAINSADDQINPPELGILEAKIKEVKHGRAVVLPITEQTRGHGTHSWPAIWKGYLEQLLQESEPGKNGQPAAEGR